MPNLEHAITQVFVVFGCPVREPAMREFLGVYSTEAAAQAFIDAQPSEEVRAQLTVLPVPLDRPSGANCPEHWADPTGLSPGYGSEPLGKSAERDRRAVLTSELTPEDNAQVAAAQSPPGFEHLDAELEDWEP
jgi:hypothetical protein